MAKDTQLEITAPAKINLFLAVLAKRPDGYHELESLMVKLALADVLHLAKRGPGIRLSCPASGLPEDRENLAFRAARAFFERTGVDGGIDIVLEKKIPVAAGLGGGSSDAAAVLKGLDALYDTGLGIPGLLELAGPLGADVPFFVLDSPAAWARGVGDLLSTVKLPDLGWLVLVNPGFAVATQWVYENLDQAVTKPKGEAGPHDFDALQTEKPVESACGDSGTFALTTQGNPYILGRGLASADDGVLSHGMRHIALCNDLEAVTLGRYPEVGKIKDALLAGGAEGALMSGSGPTVFGLFDKEEKAKRCCVALRQRYGDLVFLTKQLGA